MTLGLLSLAYLAIGLVVALVAARRGSSALDAALVVLAWPLYAPAMREPRSDPSIDEPARLAEDVRAALTTVREAAAGSPFADLLAPGAERRLLDEVARAAARMRAIDAELVTSNGSAGSTAAAALHAESDATLRALQSSDRAAMRELVELLRALRTRIVLARHAGSSAEGPAALAHELWARIDGLGEAVALSEPRIDRPDAAA